MKIQAKKYANLHGIMLGRGMPRSLMRADGQVIPGDLSGCTHAETKPVPPQAQRRFLTRSMMDPTGDWVLVVGTRRDPDLLGLIGLEFFARATLAQIDDPGNYGRPFWHPIVGGWSDRLRDDDARSHQWRSDTVGRVGALVLSGMTVDCPNDKLEKCRDLLHLNEGIPRVVLVSGGDPWQFALDRLHRRPERVVHLNRSHARADRDQG